MASRSKGISQYRNPPPAQRFADQAFYAEKVREKRRIWAIALIDPKKAQAEASMIPSASELVRRKSRAWI